MKTDEYIKNVVVAAIRRKSTDLSTWVGTQLWDQGDPELKIRLSLACDMDPGEHLKPGAGAPRKSPQPR